jgi:hypothetical protein
MIESVSVEGNTDRYQKPSDPHAQIAGDRITQLGNVARFLHRLYLNFSSSKLLFEVSLGLLPGKTEERSEPESYSFSSGSAFICCVFQVHFPSEAKRD